MSITLDRKINFWTNDLSIIVDVQEFNASEFGQWLKSQREKANLSVTALAEKSGVSKQYISLLEKASNHLLTNKPVHPALDKVEALATALGISINEARAKAGYELQNGSNIPDIIRTTIGKHGEISEQTAKLIADFIDMVAERDKK